MRLTLVAPPWNSLYRPSIQIATLAALEGEGDGDPITPVYAYLDWFEYAVEALECDPAEFVTVYDTIGEELYGLGVGDWIFGGVLDAHGAQAEEDTRARYAAFLTENGVAEELVARVLALRAVAPRFIAGLAERLLGTGAECFGFTTSFSQLMPALAVARALKDRAPDRLVLLGGANCDRPMGQAVMRAYPFVDAVVQGEGEAAVAAIRAARDMGDLTAAPGLVLRHEGGLRVSLPTVQPAETAPVPRYAEYFERLRALPYGELISPHVALPFQMSRGCWWGEKLQCTFCGENGSGMVYRSKPGRQLTETLRRLTEEHGVFDTYAVDTILARNDNGLAELAAAEVDITTFFEVKANLGPRELGEMRAAGVTMVQPGIESLSSGALKLLRKGATAFHNLRFLVLCQELGIDAQWNLLSAMPEESAGMLEEQLRLIPFITHLAPPSTVSKVRVDRYSPYFEKPDEFGIALSGPEPKYRFVHSGRPAAERTELAYSFDHVELVGRSDRTAEEMLALRRRLGARVGLWKKLHEQSRFTFRYGPNMTVLHDGRPHVGTGRHVLRGGDDLLFRRLVHGGRLHQAIDQVSAVTGQSEDDVRRTLRDWARRGWIHLEGRRGLVLAVRDSMRDELGRAAELRETAAGAVTDSAADSATDSATVSATDSERADETGRVGAGR
ncbi:RiPP maturation radical SAM C-methyltransferase [Streptomyces ipomoeae]|uniref:RiPP maturation radical SAM C-methyltransferase n=1 Tax=Streptomyces ipomoeae TaxID=103232 RepID=UPI0011471923|nr:RiPP maturation radical SAM C-methyltransferase [Streptomyces ipomoeae]MDX2939682.1 RiPP maturation radical SAM C-methyltransferase [Streptomyces ipomoeae]TQE19913.1 RiPP maturation radical SAM protein 1 [Streptomyces ipomoeae]